MFEVWFIYWRKTYRFSKRWNGAGPDVRDDSE
jgi:hypothetical protein